MGKPERVWISGSFNPINQIIPKKKLPDIDWKTTLIALPKGFYAQVGRKRPRVAGKCGKGPRAHLERGVRDGAKLFARSSSAEDLFGILGFESKGGSLGPICPVFTSIWYRIFGP